MKEYSLSLDVISAEASLQGLTSELGATPSGSSHDLGSPRVRQDLWKETVWRLESEAPASASLEDHCQSLLAKAQASGALEASRGLRNAKTLLNLGVFFDGPMCTVEIPQLCLDAIKDYSLGLEITCYCSKAEE
jgi:hypothetical protein